LSTDGIKNIIESIIFASDEEIPLKEIIEILDSFKIEIKANEIEECIKDLNSEYENNNNSFEIIKIAGGFQFSTRKKFAHFVGKLYTETQKKKLSSSAIETLAIIAYKQPITRSDIEFVRGVNVDYIVNSLLERDLITIKGRADGPGRPILYGTTANFLKVIGLNSLDDLPKLKEINDMLKNEKIEGITEADIDLFNSINSPSQDIQGTLQPEQGESFENISSNENNPDIKEENISEHRTENQNGKDKENG